MVSWRWLSEKKRGKSENHSRKYCWIKTWHHRTNEALPRTNTQRSSCLYIFSIVNCLILDAQHTSALLFVRKLREKCLNQLNRHSNEFRIFFLSAIFFLHFIYSFTQHDSTHTIITFSSFFPIVSSWILLHISPQSASVRRVDQWSLWFADLVARRA